ncbi:hypothetical protein ANCCEY_02192 [Ancylostoma ceylanicum]|uniref:Apple domain-containing protein n=1 Tax=Ancylostoma ceylanicum TaxID=53326 RepID=A0A0D6M584_9BILA|nr:hypothetical protein ANCCEY_02192 [Ancylostoma ceylanicum]
MFRNKVDEKRTLSSVTQCEELCLTQPTMCKTAQYDMDKSICEIFSAPPLLGSDTQKTSTPPDIFLTYTTL